VKCRQSTRYHSDDDDQRPSHGKFILVNIPMSIMIAAISGALFMAQVGSAEHIEPGKQLPQSVTVHVGEKAAMHDVTIRYMLFVPKGYTAHGQKWPLMLFLHGLGECSNDDLNRVKIHGQAKIVDGQPDFPFVLVTPQCPPPKGEMKDVAFAWKPEELIQLVDHTIAQLNIDPDRVYVTGLSMGGYGTWRLAATYPDRFAAAVPICGGGDPATMAKPLSKVPIWAFHGAKDPVVPVKESQEMVDAIRREHGDVQLTIYPDAQHNSWAATYDNPKLYDWLLAHRRNGK
jgi:predicted peptidase